MGSSYESSKSPSSGADAGAPCGGTAPCKLPPAPPPPAPPPIKAEIEINNTPATNDDIVQLKCAHPSHRHTVPCRIRLVAPLPPSSVNVVLTNPDGRLRFPNPADTTTALTLPANGSWVGFDITGESASAAKDDATIEAHRDTAGGAVVATKTVTVFSFDPASMTLTQGGNYQIVGARYTVAGNVAVRFSSQATLKPAGLDCTAPQLVNLRIGIMQESSNFIITTTWNNPTVVWAPGAASGTNFSVPTTMRERTNYDPSVAQPVNDGANGAAPLYSQRAESLKPPIGCTGGAAAVSRDTPSHGVNTTFSQNFSSGATPIATVTWNNLVNTTRTEHFRTFCVVFNTATSQFCALREAIWDLNADSAAAGPQQATVNADAAASADPATGVQANNAPNQTTHSGVGGATTPFTKP